METKPYIHFVPWHCLQHWQLCSLDVEREMVDGWVAQGKQDGVQGQALHCKIFKISDLKSVTCILILSSPSSAVDSGIRPAIAFKPSPWFFTAPDSLEIKLCHNCLCFMGCDISPKIDATICRILSHSCVGHFPINLHINLLCFVVKDIYALLLKS